MARPTPASSTSITSQQLTPFRPLEGHDLEDDHGLEGHELHGHGAEDPDDCQLQERTLVDGSNQISSVPLMDLSWTFQLHSSPTSSKVIYLDFDGHTTTGTSWNSSMGASFYSPAYDLDGNPASFNSEELSRIQQIWQRVAADFAPFDVDVTTQAPPTDWLIKSSSSDANYGMRAVITSYGPSSSTAGGIAKVGSFTASTDTPCFIYNKSLTGVAEAISHEVGHTLGLSHDGSSTGAYYYGHGSGETSWAPIMGVGYNKNVTQWDNGTYYGSTNGSSSANYGRGASDMAVITTYNGFGYKSDAVGNSLSAAAPLAISAGQVAQFGRIETAQDADVYSFALQSSGDVNLKFDPYWYRASVDRDGIWGGSSLEYSAPVSDGNGATAYADSGTNLDLAVSLYNGSGGLLGNFDAAGLATTLAWSNLAAGTYYLRLDGVGAGSPTSSSPSGYSDYGSVGDYFISGTISGTISGATASPLLITATIPSSTSTTTSTTTKSTAPTLAAGIRSLSFAAMGDGALAAAEPDDLTGLQGAEVLGSGRQGDALLAPLPGLASSRLSGATLIGALLPGVWEAGVPAPLAPPLLGSGTAESGTAGSGAALLSVQPWAAGSTPIASVGGGHERPIWALV